MNAGLIAGLGAVGLLTLLALGAGALALGASLYPRLRSEEQGYPLEAEIEAVVLPWVYQGICSAYRLSEESMDELQTRLRGTDKKEVAHLLYMMLPNQIAGYDIRLVKTVVTQERFEQLVQVAFDEFDATYVSHREIFRRKFEAWKVVNAGAS